MKMMGLSLNTMSLGGLALAIGVVLANEPVIDPTKVRRNLPLPFGTERSRSLSWMRPHSIDSPRSAGRPSMS